VSPATNKKCCKCQDNKPLSDFRFREDRGKYHDYCFLCEKEYNKEYYLKNRNEIIENGIKYKKENPDKVKESNKNSYIKHRKKRSISQKKYNILRKEDKREYDKKYRKTNKEKIKDNKKKWLDENKDNLILKLSRNLRSRIGHIINDEAKAGSAVKDLGCSIEELKLHLEKQFYPNPDTGEEMNWNNRGLYGWHIDHIKPLILFDLTDREQFLKACHYTNLQPLWAKDHHKKTELDVRNKK
jgi:hypothetical protein